VRRLALCAALTAALLAGCGETAKLDRRDARVLAAAREQLDETLDKAEALRTSREEARRLVRLVKRRGGKAIGLDPRDAGAFVRYGLTDPGRALLRPAEEAVDRIDDSLDEADRETKIRTLRNQTAEAYLEEAERDVRPDWPDLADRLEDARDEL
jgi:outer membrane murein-binding lipoprotein Lpp